ncbi:phage tail sheath subtilisin-like domain-containing protein [Brevundimonas faecalis]|uniref:phage tail sheath subtilisin-like domain-containing protein n=1 Tax=Brevundimonas faecalis TaxID=947378 RepID=UPI0036178271
MSDYLHGVEVIHLTEGGRPIQVQATSVIGIVGTAPFADPAAFPLDQPIRITKAEQAAALKATMPANAAAGAEGTLPTSIAAIYDQVRTPIVVIRVESEAVLADQLVKVVGSQDESTGVYALLAARAATGLKPKILIATGWTHQQVGGAANPVVAALKTVAARLRAVTISDGPNDTDTAALSKAALETGGRTYPVDPTVGVLDRTGAIIQRPSSAHVAGLGARSDQERGFWWSWSNQTINGVVTIGRPIEFSMSDTSASSNMLNGGGVAVIVNEDGFRLWGNRFPGLDNEFPFLAQRRTMDVIFDSIEANFRWAMDRPFSANLLDDIAGNLDAFIRDLKRRGAVIGGRVWIDPELNTPETFRLGQLFVNFDGEPSAPLDRLTFRFRRETGYYAELISGGSTPLAA